ncbi:MAG: hypothetical protein AAFQ80_07765 [Cyanobacteria bacterium J06621_8]
MQLNISWKVKELIFKSIIILTVLSSVYLAYSDVGKSSIYKQQNVFFDQENTAIQKIEKCKNSVNTLKISTKSLSTSKNYQKQYTNLVQLNSCLEGTPGYESYSQKISLIIHDYNILSNEIGKFSPNNIEILEENLRSLIIRIDWYEWITSSLINYRISFTIAILSMTFVYLLIILSIIIIVLKAYHSISQVTFN